MPHSCRCGPTVALVSSRPFPPLFDGAGGESPDPFAGPLPTSERRTGAGLAPEIPIVDFDDSEIASRWVSRRDAARSSQAAAVMSGRRVDLVLDDDETYEPASQEAIHHLTTGLASPRCTELHANGPDEIYAKYDGRYAAINCRFASVEEYNRYVQGLVTAAEATQSWADVVKARQAVLQMADGSSITLVMPPITKHIEFSIRKRTVVSWTPQDLIDNGTMSKPMMDFLRACVRARVNLLIVGPMGSGKTSTLSILTHEFGAGERVAVVEEVPEIQVNIPQVSYHLFDPDDPALDLAAVLDKSLYRRFMRVIVGEIHWTGLSNMLRTMTIGSDGSMSTYHADSVERAIRRMIVDLQTEHPNMSAETAAGRVRDAIELVVVLDQQQGTHRCLQIGELDWRQGDRDTGVGITPLFQWVPDIDGGGEWHPQPPDQQGRVIRKARKYGVIIDPRWFRSMHFDADGRQAAPRRR